MIYFVGAGCGAADLITVRGADLIRRADVLIYAGSLVNPELLRYAREDCRLYNSAHMALDEIIEVMADAESKNQMTVRLHTGEPSIYGAVQEQMRQLDRRGIPYESCPGVSACFGAAASLNLEYTLPGVSQSLIITRMEGRTPVPPAESIERFAAHGASMAIYLSTGMMDELSRRLMTGGYSADTPAAIVYKATWPEEEKYICTVATLPAVAAAHNIRNLAVVLVGDAIAHQDYADSRLYAPDFETGFRKARTPYESAKSIIHLATYTDSAKELAHRLMTQWPEYIPVYHDAKDDTASWVPEAFRMHQPILFIAASGIAVRAIASSVRDKLTDSPVLVMDEKGKHVVPLLSGHLGGANELAREIARRIGADPVLTTATDVNGLFSVDDFARRNGLRIQNREAIRKVSAKLLRGESITLRCDVPASWDGEVPERVVEWRKNESDLSEMILNKALTDDSLVTSTKGAGSMCVSEKNTRTKDENLRQQDVPDVWIGYSGAVDESNSDMRVPSCTSHEVSSSESRGTTCNPDPRHLKEAGRTGDEVKLASGTATLHLVPRDLVLGIGCKRGTSFEALHEFVSAMLQKCNLNPEDVGSIASVTQKREEIGLIELAQFYRVPLHLYTAEALEQVMGDFPESDFVRATIGTGNVCQRAAALDSADPIGYAGVQSRIDGDSSSQAVLDETEIEQETNSEIRREVMMEPADAIDTESANAMVAGELILPKTAGDGITVSIYRRKYFRFRW